jgi:hypothetical protein
MSHPGIIMDQWYRLRVYAHQIRLEAQKLRWQAAQIRHQASLIRLAPHMSRTNPLTLEVATAIFRQYGLLSFTDTRPALLPAARDAAVLKRLSRDRFQQQS